MFNPTSINSAIQAIISTDGDMGFDVVYGLAWGSDNTVVPLGFLSQPATFTDFTADPLATGHFQLWATHTFPSNFVASFYLVDPTVAVYDVTGNGAFILPALSPSFPTPQDDSPWFDADRFVDPRDAPSAYFETGVFDAQHGVRQSKIVDPLYQKNYDEGFAFGAQLDIYLSNESM